MPNSHASTHRPVRSRPDRGSDARLHAKSHQTKRPTGANRASFPRWTLAGSANSSTQASWPPRSRACSGEPSHHLRVANPHQLRLTDAHTSPTGNYWAGKARQKDPLHIMSLSSGELPRSSRCLLVRFFSMCTANTHRKVLPMALPDSVWSELIWAGNSTKGCSRPSPRALCLLEQGSHFGGSSDTIWDRADAMTWSRPLAAC